MVWERMIHGETDAAERKRLRATLLAYCKQDTLGWCACWTFCKKHEGRQSLRSAGKELALASWGVRGRRAPKDVRSR